MRRPRPPCAGAGCAPPPPEPDRHRARPAHRRRHGADAQARPAAGDALWRPLALGRLHRPARRAHGRGATPGTAQPPGRAGARTESRRHGAGRGDRRCGQGQGRARAGAGGPQRRARGAARRRGRTRPRGPAGQPPLPGGRGRRLAGAGAAARRWNGSRASRRTGSSAWAKRRTCWQASPTPPRPRPRRQAPAPRSPPPGTPGSRHARSTTATAAPPARRRQRLEAIARDRAGWQRRASDEHGAALRARLATEQARAVELADKPATLAADLEALADRLIDAEAERRVAADRLAAAEAALAERDRGLKAAESAASQARESRIRAGAAHEQSQQATTHLTERIRERLALSPQHLPPPPQGAAEGDLEQRLARLQREREGLGTVNLLADEEITALDDQLATLTAERDDLTAAIAKLRRGIGDLNRNAREKLLAAFESVNGHFGRLFTRLFGGGEAQLRLVGDDDPLEAGLEVFACPPGKKPQALTALSGGERALTAVALLFAAFLTNPAPICVLDEVDAPLDDANVDRLCRLIEEIADEAGTRFLCITHHRLTMARMDRLFGVTMEERGVSRLVSVDLRQADSLRQMQLPLRAAE
ncbi:MAG: hypothetical protein H6844_17245 [Alphaproteobacteria bacterium]|nr:hypothetical protein [Alphaproteobacteria bacterium]